MTIIYKIKDIQGHVNDIEIEKDKTVKDFKAKIEGILHNEIYRRDLIKIIYKQSILQDDQTIESIGAEENTCFSISSIPTVKINFVLPTSFLENPSNLNLKLNDFLIEQNCTDSTKIINAICYQEPSLSPEKICIYTDKWQSLTNPISVQNGTKFGLYIQKENSTPLFFKSENMDMRYLYVFPSDKPLDSYEKDISINFGDNSYVFNYNGASLDLKKNAGNFCKFAVITVSPDKCNCILL